MELKHLLIGVCFWWKLIYSKETSLQTPEIPFIYKLSEELESMKNKMVGEAGIEPTTNWLWANCSNPWATPPNAMLQS